MTHPLQKQTLESLEKIHNLGTLTLDMANKLHTDIITSMKTLAATSPDNLASVAMEETRKLQTTSTEMMITAWQAQTKLMSEMFELPKA